MTAPDNAPAIVAPSDHATDISFGEILCNSWQPLALVWLKTLKTRHDSFCKTALEALCGRQDSLSSPT